MIKSRSKTLSKFGEFVLGLLLSICEFSTDLRDLFKDSESDLIQNIRVLADSKLGHVQSAVEHILSILLRRRKWRGLVSSTYANADTIVDDVIDASSRTHIGSKPPLIATFVLDFLLEAVDVVKQQRIKIKRF